MRNRAIKKVQIAIDKMVDLMEDMLQDGLYDQARRIKDSLNELEADISNAKIKGGKLTR